MSPEQMGIRQAAPVSLMQRVPPGMNPRRWTWGSPIPTASLGPIATSRHNSSPEHLTQHLQKETGPCIPIFQRETSPGWAYATGPLGRSCWHWCSTRWGPGRARGDAALRGSWAGMGTYHIAGDSSGELDLALLPGSSWTLLAQCKLLPTHTPGRDVNKKLQDKGDV